MSTDGQLSEISLAYLEYYDEILQGQKALGADIATVLDTVFDQLPDKTDFPANAVNEFRLKRTWPLPWLSSDAGLVLRFFWPVEAPRKPRFTYELTGGSAAAQLSGLLSASGTWGDRTVPSIEWDELIKDPVPAIVEAWKKACTSTEELTEFFAGARPSHALALMREVARQLHDGPQTERLAGLGVAVDTDPGRVDGTGKGSWAAYVQTRPDWDGLPSRTMINLVYETPSAAEGERGGRLLLVVYSGKETGWFDLRPELAKGSYAGRCPIIGDFTAALDELVASGPVGEDAELVAAKSEAIVEQWSESTRQLHSLHRPDLAVDEEED